MREQVRQAKGPVPKCRADDRDMVRAIRKASALFEPMASEGFDVVMETPTDEAPDPESDGPCADGSGPDQGQQARIVWKSRLV